MNQHRISETSILLICSVGGTPQPIVASIKQYHPARVILWHTTGTKQAADQVVRDSKIAPGCVDYRLVRDEQDFAACVSDARKLRADFGQWKNRSDSHEVIVDFTGGTKLMSTALVLVTHRWKCRFSYVGGTQRTKDGVGIVVDGTEKAIRSDNPLDTLAYQPIQDASHLFNHRQPAAAAAILEPFTKRDDLDPAIKRQLVAVGHLATAYAQWDAFQHKAAVACFNKCLNAANDLDAALPNHGLTPTITAHRDLCNTLAADEGKPSHNLILDLLANADRRAADRRFDDATARLYRATEALAQLVLLQDHQIHAVACPIDKLPDSLRQTWASRATNGLLKLALQDAYTLFAELGHSLGKSFRDLKLHENTSPLAARNHSILAHGFAPTTDAAYKALRDPIHQLAGSPNLQAFSFPELPSP